MFFLMHLCVSLCTNEETNLLYIFELSFVSVVVLNNWLPEVTLRLSRCYSIKYVSEVENETVYKDIRR